MIKSIYWLSLNAYHECRGEIDQGILSVCHVVLNRARIRGKPIKDIIYEHYQFSWTNDHLPDTPFSEPESYKRCRKLAIQAIDEFINGQHFFADHYHHHSITPYWADSMKNIGKIGDHVFYRSPQCQRMMNNTKH